MKKIIALFGFLYSSAAINQKVAPYYGQKPKRLITG
jgi:hypothetical protein